MQLEEAVGVSLHRGTKRSWENISSISRTRPPQRRILQVLTSPWSHSELWDPKAATQTPKVPRPTTIYSPCPPWWTQWQGSKVDSCCYSVMAPMNYWDACNVYHWWQLLWPVRWWHQLGGSCQLKADCRRTKMFSVGPYRGSVPCIVISLGLRSA